MCVYAELERSFLPVANVCVCVCVFTIEYQLSGTPYHVIISININSFKLNWFDSYYQFDWPVVGDHGDCVWLDWGLKFSILKLNSSFEERAVCFCCRSSIKGLRNSHILVKSRASNTIYKSRWHTILICACVRLAHESVSNLYINMLLLQYVLVFK